MYNTKDLNDFFNHHLDQVNHPKKIIVGYSGGLDSTVLLYSLTRINLNIPILAIHINHQQHHLSSEWEKFCINTAKVFGVKLISEKIQIEKKLGKATECEMRDHRYKVLRKYIEPNDWLMTAHHKNDQAETLLLSILRGSGVDGLSGIKPIRIFADGMLLRPLLGYSKAELINYAKIKNLEWIEDFSNEDNSFDRNFLRNKIIPQLEKRWPSINKRFYKVTSLALEASERSEDIAKIDLFSIGNDKYIDSEKFIKLSDNRQRNLIRFILRMKNLQHPSYKQLVDGTKALRLIINGDKNKYIKLPDANIYNYRKKLYVIPQLSIQNNESLNLFPNKTIYLNNGMGSISLKKSKDTGIDPRILQDGLKVSFRVGGEVIKPSGKKHHYKLKKLFQEYKIYPWMRGRIPLLFYGNEIVSVGNLWIAEKFSKSKGYIIKWYQKPELND